jgi:hypothetical protein
VARVFLSANPDAPRRTQDGADEPDGLGTISTNADGRRRSAADADEPGGRRRTRRTQNDVDEPDGRRRAPTDDDRS